MSAKDGRIAIVIPESWVVERFTITQGDRSWPELRAWPKDGPPDCVIPDRIDVGWPDEIDGLLGDES